ncbi:MAG: TetR/AcrR family transcriptional regulator [bacterium]|nr:TetR/AcrR family transcriptional regulator [bacterium]
MVKTGRPRKFDEDDIIQKAMMLFWERGYEGVSMADLEAATGLARVSLYNAIGDKETLFMRALDGYMEMARGVLQGCIIDQDLPALVAFFEGMAEKKPKDSPANWGCLMVNTVLDVKQMSKQVQTKVTAYRQMLIDGFVSSLTRARTLGQMQATDAEIESRANYLLSMMWGNLTTIRLFGDPTALKSGVDALTETIRMWGTRAR